MTDTDDGFDTIPRLLPARMVNEFTYCPRFFHLSWSGGEDADNDFTVEGKDNHRAVDRPSGSFSVDIEDNADPWNGAARSVTLSSTKLGVVARIDLVEGRDGEAVPVDHKRGSPKDPDEPVWLPEQVQLAVAGLLLREAGYTVSHGEIYFSGARRRVRVDFTDELVELVLTQLHEMRRVASDPLPPPPLVDSPKCPACVLVGICLPDEQNLLRDRHPRPPRRLLPTDSAARPLYVTEPGSSAGKDGERLVVRVKREELASVRLIDVSQLALFGNVNVSTPLMRELLARDIPVCWFSSGGWFSGLAHGLPGKNVEIRRQQVLADESRRLGVACAMIEGKILNQRTLLRRNSDLDATSTLIREMKRLAVRAAKVEDVPTLLGLEGAAARWYFGAFATMLKRDSADFDFTTRNRRPPKDPVNCLLSYLYGQLVRECTVAAFSVGLDPYVGVLHKPRFGRPAMGLDVAEEFRPLVADSVAITLINTGEIRPHDFVTRAGSCALTTVGRRKVLKAFDRRMTTEVRHPVFGYRVSYRRAVEVQVRMVAAVLLGEIEHYQPFVTR